MASPFLFYDDYVSMADDGGYNENPQVSQLTAVFLLSSLTYLRERWLWESPNYPIDDDEYQNIIFMIETAEKELMVTDQIGKIIQSISTDVPNGFLLLDGSTVLQSAYPQLTNVVPATWLSGDDIVLPNLANVTVIGDSVGTTLGEIIGENEVQLTIAEMPQHTHIQNGHNHSYNQPVVTPTAGGEIPATADITTPTPSATGSSTPTNQDTGNDEAHNNISESLVVNFYIKAF